MALLPASVSNRVLGNAKQPRGELRISSKVPEFFGNHQEDLLDQILGVDAGTTKLG
jgi:hypothetical protein